jgi:hypothetical protein
MRRLLLGATAALLIAAPNGAAAHSAVTAKVCHRGTPAQINGASKCLQAGEYCSLGAERQYVHYGYECSTRYKPPRLRRR